MAPQIGQYARVATVAKAFEIPPEHIRSWIKDDLPHYRVSERITLLKISEFDEYLQRKFRITSQTIDEKVDQICEGLLSKNHK